MTNLHNQVVRQWRPHFASVAAPTAVGFGVAGLLFALAKNMSELMTIIIRRFFEADPSAINTLALLFAGLCALLGVIIAVGTFVDTVKWLRIVYTQYRDRVTDIAPQGLLGTTSDEIYYKAIKSVTYSQSILGRLLGYRTIRLHREGKETTYDLIGTPDHFGLLEFFRSWAAANNQESSLE